LTIPEFVNLIHHNEISWSDLGYSDFDFLLNDSTGVSNICDIFG
jgi:hypothetical protein